MEYALFSLWQQSKAEAEKRQLALCNEKTERFGLVLSEQERNELILCRNQSLKKYGRIEFGQGILEKLINEFCDSQFIEQEEYGATLQKLQDIFYEFKKETEDQVADDELLHFMKEQFEKICFGDLEYLENTCLPRFAAAVRGGYRGYMETEGYGEYAQFDEESRWDEGLFYQTLGELTEG